MRDILMFMPFTVPITPETEARLRAKAAAAGLDVETFAARALERVASRPSLDETLAPLRGEFEVSGISEEQLGELLEKAKHDDRAARRAGEVAVHLLRHQPLNS